jgi:hypothetical protein
VTIGPNQLSGASLAAGQALNAGTEELQAQVMQTELAAATEQAQYMDLGLLDAAASNAESDLIKPGTFTMLNDEPVNDSDRDKLNSWRIANGLVQLLKSRHLSPFVLAIDAEWGMGKSSVLSQMQRILKGHEDCQNWKLVMFNAWTAEHSDAVKDVVAAVLRELDPKIARRWARKLAHNRGLITFLYACGVALAGLLGFSSAVSNFLTMLSFRGSQRNEVRVNVSRILDDWRKQGGDDRVMVVFIDDLDRCSPDTAIQVCETIKLYLDIPGLIFVLGWNLSALGREAASLGNDRSAVRVLQYFDKVIQLTYHLPDADKEQIKNLIESYADDSGTAQFLDATARQTLAEKTRRNPRRIKQIINGFIVESTLSRKWAESPDLLIRAELIYQLYPRLYQLLIDDSDDRDLIGDFVAYSNLRDHTDDADAAWWKNAEELFRSYHLKIASNAKSDPGEVLGDLRNKFPGPLADLATDDGLTNLLRDIGDRAASAKFSALLKESPLTSAGTLTAEAEAAYAAATAAQHKLQTNTRIFQGFDQVISG